MKTKTFKDATERFVRAEQRVLSFRDDSCPDDEKAYKRWEGGLARACDEFGTAFHKLMLTPARNAAEFATKVSILCDVGLRYCNGQGIGYKTGRNKPYCGDVILPWALRAMEREAKSFPTANVARKAA